jgi:regulator of replication initiation timing
LSQNGEGLKKKLNDLEAMVKVSRTELSIVDCAKNLQKNINHDLKLKNDRDVRIHNEVESNQTLHFRLLEKNHLDLQNEYDSLMKKYLNLEMKYHGLESDKSLSNHEKVRIIEKLSQQLGDYKSENHSLRMENHQLNQNLKEAKLIRDNIIKELEEKCRGYA